MIPLFCVPSYNIEGWTLHPATESFGTLHILIEAIYVFEWMKTRFYSEIILWRYTGYISGISTGKVYTWYIPGIYQKKTFWGFQMRRPAGAVYRDRCCVRVLVRTWNPTHLTGISKVGSVSAYSAYWFLVHRFCIFCILYCIFCILAEKHWQSQKITSWYFAYYFAYSAYYFASFFHILHIILRCILCISAI